MTQVVQPVLDEYGWDLKQQKCDQNEMAPPPSFEATINAAPSTQLPPPPKVRPLGTPKHLRGEVDPKRFKTQLCQYFMQGERCPFAPHCAFAHGQQELRTVHENAHLTVADVNKLPRDILETKKSQRSSKRPIKKAANHFAAEESSQPINSLSLCAQSTPTSYTVQSFEEYGASPCISTRSSLNEFRSPVVTFSEDGSRFSYNPYAASVTLGSSPSSSDM